MHICPADSFLSSCTAKGFPIDGTWIGGVDFGGSFQGVQQRRLGCRTEALFVEAALLVVHFYATMSFEGTRTYVCLRT